MSIYGLIIGISIILAIELLKRKTTLFSYAEYLLLSIFALIGARVMFLIHNITEIQSGSIGIFNIWDGGLAFFGGLIGILFGLAIFSARKNTPFLKLSDTVLPFLPLIQAMGRIGNYFNHELYGKPSQLPWAIEIPIEERLVGYEQYETFHPAFLYESLLSLTLFFLLYKISMTKTAKGLLTGIYLIGYSVIRLLINSVRIDKEYIMGIETSDFFSCIFFVLGVILILNISKMKVKEKVAFFFSRVVMIVLVFFAAITISLQTNLSNINLAILIIFTFILPISTILLFNILGLSSDINVTKREERPKLFAILLIFFLISLFTSIYIGNQQLIIICSVTNLTFILGFLITFYWKISYHMIWSTLSIFSVIYLLNTQFTYLLLFVLPFMAWSRVILKRHTYLQVIAGTLLPLLCILLVLTLIKF